ncbi:hypothetical protein DdX_06738 [Ditylenchus destructor]|uniref:Uncharacterized protein n=1 Tax=Ditylenchus destructor TaxID=166010 RepID=A0AAD4N629_9BILA|nr:hypothetical protein DdX_06738 [Ditylenchus destructor]
MYSTSHRALDTSKWRCCGMHVEKGAFYIGLLGAALAATAAVIYFVSGSILMGIAAIVNLLIYLSILYAQKQGNPSYYLPFLIVNGLALLGHVAYCIYILLIYINMPYWYLEPMRDDWRRQGYFYNEYEFRNRLQNTLMFLGLFTLAYVLTAAFFYWVVWQAYQYMKERNRQTPPNTYRA